MRGYGKAHGAVSVVNAISIGRGCALGVDLSTEAEVELTSNGGFWLHTPAAEMDSSLAAEVFRTMKRRLGLGDMGCIVRTQSNIPVAVGLKSSSSAAVAIALALLDACGQEIPVEEVLRLVADASLRSGTSVTGAMDDAAACALGGIVLTDNLGFKLLRREKAPETHRVVILVPPGQTFKKGFNAALLQPIRNLVEEAFKLAEQGEHWKAMTINGLLHAAALSLPSDPILAALRSGAVAAGISGTGPAAAAVTTAEKVGDVVETLKGFRGQILVCQVNNVSCLSGREP